MQIEHERQVVSFERSRADGSDSQAAATGAGVVAVAALAAATHPRLTVWLGLAAAFLIIGAMAAAIARARYPPRLNRSKPESETALLKRAVEQSESLLRAEFRTANASSLQARELAAATWLRMAELERWRASCKNQWLTVALYGLILGLPLGVVGVIAGT